jgi:hypothetical protein
METLLATIRQLSAAPLDASASVSREPTEIPPPCGATPQGELATGVPTERKNPVLSVHTLENGSSDVVCRESAWFPAEPADLRGAGVSEGQLEHLLLKALQARGDLTGRELSVQHAFPYRLIEPILHGLKYGQLVTLRAAAAMGDYLYQLTDLGRERAKRLSDACPYFGAVPVTLPAYVASVACQSPTRTHPTEDDLQRAFADLLVNPRVLSRLGPAVNSGRGLFLYGKPGNGKTSIAERVTRAFGDCIWIPKAIGIEGEIVRVFDPGMHEEVPLDAAPGPLQEAFDRRWVRVRRPTIVVGGELTMDSLEMTTTAPGISEASLQMKSNCGTLVIDDFGRQRMSTDELLNRWIVPLEKRYDFLRLNNGKKVQVPFDQLIIFSTNLEPKHLVDEAFLRRIPYKIEIEDPSEEEFRELFRIMAPKLGLAHDEAAVDYLIDAHYRPAQRPFRCCQPRDLLLQVVNYCRYMNRRPALTPEHVDQAVANYFAVM